MSVRIVTPTAAQILGPLEPAVSKLLHYPLRAVLVCYGIAGAGYGAVRWVRGHGGT